MHPADSRTHPILHDRDPRAPHKAATTLGVNADTELFSTAEVMTHTGLSRQTLHTYKRMGLISIARRNASGRCYYEASVFERLRRIKLYKRHRPLRDVRAVLDAEDAVEEAPSHSSRQRAVGRRRALTLARADPPPTPPTPPAPPASGSDAPVAPPKLYRIGEVMARTTLSRQTIHNYTVQGLLTEAGRTPAGHRLYDAAVFERIQVIERLKRHRSLDEVQRLLDLAEGGNGESSGEPAAGNLATAADRVASAEPAPPAPGAD